MEHSVTDGQTDGRPDCRHPKNSATAAITITSVALILSSGNDCRLLSRRKVLRILLKSDGVCLTIEYTSCKQAHQVHIKSTQCNSSAVACLFMFVCCSFAGFEIISHDSDPTVCCIVSPIMKRCRQLPSCDDVLFCDTTASVDRQGMSVTFIMTATKAGH